MKTLLILLSLTVCLNAGAAAKKKPAPKKDARTRICEKLIAYAEERCDEAMCEQQNEDPTDADGCVRDGDFYEGQQICVWDGELQEQIDSWNKRSKFKIKDCDDL